MNKDTAHLKGSRLEQAVLLIEKSILEVNPALKEAKIHIQPNKIIISEGVMHEIDVFVEVDLGSGYNSIFIFECKNWKESIGKNHLIIFSEKIKAFQAQTGFFIAKRFGRFAQAQAKKDPRIKLLIVDDRPPISDLLDIFRFSETTNSHALAEVGCRSEEGTLVIDPKKSIVNYGGEISTFHEFIQNLIQRTKNEKVDYKFVHEHPDRIHAYKHTKEFKFSPNELIIETVFNI